MENMDSMWSRVNDYFAYFGLATAFILVTRVSYCMVHFMRNYLLAKPLRLGKDFNVKSFGQWGVVTGSTDGIGKAYAQELAKRGLDIVLISRSPDKLREVSGEIESQYKVKTRAITADFTKTDIYENIRKELAGLDIAVLVNNVGISYEFPEFYHSIDKATVERLVSVNCQSVAQMTHIVLPGMIEKKKGAIINISSASASKPTPLLTLYSATKVFVDTFSRALQAEVAEKKIIVQCVLPSFVATKMSKMRRETIMIPGPTTYVQSALATLGLQTRTYGYYSHGIQWGIIDLVPEWIYLYLSFGNLSSIRKRAVQRKEAKKE